MRKGHLPQNYSKRFILLLGVAPALLTGLLIFHNAVDSPVLDEWHIVFLFQKLTEGTLSFNDLFAQRNEYRQFFPNVVFVSVGWLTKGDVRYLMALTFLAACLISLAIYLLEKQTIPDDQTRLWTFLATNLLIFSPIQHENWLQGQQLIYFIPMLCLSLCLLIGFSARFRTRTKFLICAILATVGSFSSANGLLLWLIVLPVLAWPFASETLSQKKWWVIAWSVLFFLNAGLYFHGYRSVAEHPPVLSALTQPLTAVLYFLVILGRPVSLGRLALAIPIGLTLLIFFTWSSFRFWQSWKRGAAGARSELCWLIIGYYSLLTAVLITIGRSGFGLEQALSSNRYSTFSIYLPVAIVNLVFLKLAPNAAGHLFHSPLESRSLLRLILAVFIAVHVPIYVLGIRQMSSFRVRLLQSKACASLINVIEDDCVSHSAVANFDAFKQQINIADRLGLLRPALLKSSRIQEIAVKDEDEPTKYGSFQRLVHLGGDKYIASGWAFLPHRGEPADAVLLAYEQDADNAIIFAVAKLNVERDFVSTVLGRGVYLDSSWTKAFSAKQLEQNRSKLSAWALDAVTGRAYELEGTPVLQSPISRQLKQ